MKKIYVAHSIGYPEFQKTLYAPLRTITGCEFIFPHEDEVFKPSTEIIKNCDLFIADVSYQKLGVGIEIGRAEMLERPILFIYKNGSKLSRSLSYVSRNVVEYDSVEKDISKITQAIRQLI